MTGLLPVMNQTLIPFISSVDNHVNRRRLKCEQLTMLAITAVDGGL